jgi:hypothetical protein
MQNVVIFGWSSREEERVQHLSRLFQHVKLTSLSTESLLKLQADTVIQSGDRSQSLFLSPVSQTCLLSLSHIPFSISVSVSCRNSLFIIEKIHFLP